MELASVAMVPAPAVGGHRSARASSAQSRPIFALPSQIRISRLRSSAAAGASEKLQISADDQDKDMTTQGKRLREAPDNNVLLALVLSLGLAVGSAEAARALGPEGPLVEEFWDNMRRYGLYFVTVLSGGLYSLLQPIFSLLRNPFTAFFTIAFLTGSFYLLYLTLNTMLGITAFHYDYAS